MACNVHTGYDGSLSDDGIRVGLVYPERRSPRKVQSWRTEVTLEVQSKSLCVRQRRTTKKKECVIVEAHFKGGLRLKGLFLVKGVNCCEGGALVAVM